MSGARGQKVVRILVEFPRPDRLLVVAKACPYCEALPGDECRSYTGIARNFHMQRIALALGYEPTSGRNEVYRRKER